MTKDNPTMMMMMMMMLMMLLMMLMMMLMMMLKEEEEEEEKSNNPNLKGGEQSQHRSCWMVLLVGRGALEQHTLQLLGPRTDEVPQVLGGWVPRERSRHRTTAAARA